METATETVSRIFRNVLQREPDGSTLRAFGSAIDRGMSPNDVVRAAVVSSEGRRQVDPIVRTYQAAFGRVPDRAGLNTWVNALRQGRDLKDVAQDFTQSAEFTARYETGRDIDAAFIQSLYVNVLGRYGKGEEVQNWLTVSNLPGSGYKSRGDLLFAFAQSGEFMVRSRAPIDAFLTQAGNGSETYVGSLLAAPGGRLRDAENSAIRQYELTTATIDFNSINYRTSFEQSGFKVVVTGSHTDYADSLYWHDDGANNLGNSDVIITFGGRPFNIEAVDLIEGTSEITAGNDTFVLAERGSFVQVALLNVTSATFHADESGAHIDNLRVSFAD